MPMKNPPHPGDFIRTEIVQPAGLSVTAAAAALKVSRPALSSLLNGKANLSGDMALRIEKAFGVTMDTLMRMQSAYDIAQTRLRERHIRVRRIPTTSGAYGRAHRQATALLDGGFHLGGAIPASRDETNER
jgi:addiction module HigA family antidote